MSPYDYAIGPHEITSTNIHTPIDISRPFDIPTDIFLHMVGFTDANLHSALSLLNKECCKALDKYIWSDISINIRENQPLADIKEAVDLITRNPTRALHIRPLNIRFGTIHDAALPTWCNQLAIIFTIASQISSLTLRIYASARSYIMESIAPSLIGNNFPLQLRSFSSDLPEHELSTFMESQLRLESFSFRYRGMMHLDGPLRLPPSIKILEGPLTERLRRWIPKNSYIDKLAMTFDLNNNLHTSSYGIFSWSFGTIRELHIWSGARSLEDIAEHVFPATPALKTLILGTPSPMTMFLPTVHHALAAHPSIISIHWQVPSLSITPHPSDFACPSLQEVRFIGQKPTHRTLWARISPSSSWKMSTIPSIQPTSAVQAAAAWTKIWLKPMSTLEAD